MEADEGYLALSGIQHFAYCRRQWALIHIEQQWQENLRTVQGELFHERAHGGGAESRDGLYLVRGLTLVSRRLAIRGVADVVEFHRDAGGVPLHGRQGRYRPAPVEYKRGRPKDHDADRLQLTAQAMCLEEMLGCEIHEGALFYGETRRRQAVRFDGELRGRVEALCREMHALYLRGHTPGARREKRCAACSLAGVCLPELGQRPSAKAYLIGRLEERE